jgi:hypothetical protein
MAGDQGDHDTATPQAALPGHTDEPPRGIFTMAVSILWGVLAFAFGFEAVVNFNDWMRPAGTAQDAAIAGIDIVSCVALGIFAVILWKAKDWLPKRVADSAIAVSTNPSIWVAVALVLLIISTLPQLRLYGISPIAKDIGRVVQQTSNPSPTADEIANAVSSKLRPMLAGQSTSRAVSAYSLDTKISFIASSIGNIDNRPILEASFVPRRSGQSLRVFLEYSWRLDLFVVGAPVPASWSPPIRILLRDIPDYYENEPITVTIIRKHRDITGSGGENWVFRFGGLM